MLEGLTVALGVGLGVPLVPPKPWLGEVDGPTPPALCVGVGVGVPLEGEGSGVGEGGVLEGGVVLGPVDEGFVEGLVIGGIWLTLAPGVGGLQLAVADGLALCVPPGAVPDPVGKFCPVPLLPPGLFPPPVE